MKTILIVGLLFSNLFFLSGIYVLSMTRAEAVTFLTKIAIARKPELADRPAESPFTDIDNTPQKDYIELAYAIGITAGTSETTFSPDVVTPLWQWAILYGKMIQVSRH